MNIAKIIVTRWAIMFATFLIGGGVIALRNGHVPTVGEVFQYVLIVAASVTVASIAMVLAKPEMLNQTPRDVG